MNNKTNTIIMTDKQNTLVLSLQSIGTVVASILGCVFIFAFIIIYYCCNHNKNNNKGIERTDLMTDEENNMKEPSALPLLINNNSTNIIIKSTSPLINSYEQNVAVNLLNIGNEVQLLYLPIPIEGEK